MLPQTFIFFGRSGCGKGTQALLLEDYLKKHDPKRNVLIVETGRELRNFIDEFSPKGNYSAKLVKEVLDSGGLLPEFMPIWIWTKYFVENVKGDEHWILDGLSRRPSEAPVLDGAFKFYKREQPFVILISVSRQWSLDRLLARGRYDDSVEEINKRLDWFDNHVAPTIEFFKRNPFYRFVEVNGQQTIGEVHRALISAVRL
ncbi:MAG: adenylate kinase-like kinase [Parcubacteria group bacterium Greene0416_79]|nr:MAG: adenylate kinase-like kinase [Parcubacteria group bacterium Greene0416_79]